MLKNKTVPNPVKRHTFSKPAKPLAPPTPRASTLGLDRLALEKRAAASQEEEIKKRRRVDSQEPHFKGLYALPSHNIGLLTSAKFLPSPRLAQVMHASVLKKHPLILVASLQRVARYSRPIGDGVTITEVSLRPSLLHFSLIFRRGHLSASRKGRTTPAWPRRLSTSFQPRPWPLWEAARSSKLGADPPLGERPFS